MIISLALNSRLNVIYCWGPSGAFQLFFTLNLKFLLCWFGVAGSKVIRKYFQNMITEVLRQCRHVTCDHVLTLLYSHIFYIICLSPSFARTHTLTQCDTYYGDWCCQRREAAVYSGINWVSGGRSVRMAVCTKANIIIIFSV